MYLLTISICTNEKKVVSQNTLTQSLCESLWYSLFLRWWNDLHCTFDTWCTPFCYTLIDTIYSLLVPLRTCFTDLIFCRCLLWAMELWGSLAWSKGFLFKNYFFNFLKTILVRYCRGTFTKSYKKTIGVDFLEKQLRVQSEEVARAWLPSKLRLS